MRILIVSQYYWPENFRINDLAAGLVERGHQITVLTGIPNYPEGSWYPGYGFFKKRKEFHCGVNIIRVPLIPRGNAGKFRLVLNFFSFAFFASVIAPFVCRGHFDSIFVFEPSPVTVGLPALVMKMVKKAPVFFWVQDLWPQSLSATGVMTSPWLLKQVDRLVRFIYQHCDLVLAASPGFLPVISSHGVSPERVKYFPNSVESIYRPLLPGLQSESLPALPEGFRIVYAGNIGVAQDFPTILSAAEILRMHPDIHWIILGDGRMRDWVEEEVRCRNLTERIHLLGRYPMEDIPKLFAYADLLLITLKKDPVFSLTIPSKIQSCMACSKPIVAAMDGEGARLLSASGAGIAVPSGDAIQLSKAVLTFREMPKERRIAIGQSGKNYCDTHFRRDLLIDRLVSMMREKTGA